MNLGYLVVIAVILLIGINVPYTTSEPYTEIENYSISEPYSTTESYYEKEPYEAIENVNVPYQETVNTQWAVTWYTITGSGQWGSSVGNSTFPATFYYDWDYGSIFSSYNDYVGFIATSTINVPQNRPVYFKLGSDDGSKLYVDGTLIIDLYSDHPYDSADKTIQMTAGKHSLLLYYYERASTALVSFDTDKEILTWQEQKSRTEQKKTIRYRDVAKQRTEIKYNDVNKSRKVIKNRDVYQSLIQRLNNASSQNNLLFSSETTKTNFKQQGTISIYIDTLPYGVDPTFSNAIREAQAYWEKKQNVVFKEASNQKDADIIVNWVKEFGGKTLGHTVNENFIEIGLGDSRCLGKWKPYKYRIVSDIAIHELGHSLGYIDDYNNTANVMYYMTNTSYEIEIEEDNILPNDIVRFYPVCTRSQIATYSIEVTSSDPLDIYVVASKKDYEFFLNDKTFSHYPKCQGKGVENYKTTCTVSSESGIILKKTESLSNLRPSAEYTIKIKEV